MRNVWDWLIVIGGAVVIVIFMTVAAYLVVGTLLVVSGW